MDDRNSVVTKTPRAANLGNLVPDGVIAVDAPVADAVVTREELLHLGALGDSLALARLESSLRGPVRRVLQRQSGDSQRSDVMMRQAFDSIWQSAAHFDVRRGRATSWVLMMAHHHAAAHQHPPRTRYQRRRYARALIGAIVRDHCVAADARRGEYRRITKVLGRLTSSQGEVVALAALDGFDVREIAAILGVPTRTVMMRLRAGLTRVQKELKDTIPGGLAGC